MTLVRWNPVRDMNRMNNVWNSMFENWMNTDNDEEVIQQVWRPRVDIIESGDVYKVLADLPGMNKDDIEIALDNNVLTIKGERKIELEEKKENAHLTERAYGKFIRKFNLRNVIDTAKIDASFKDGVLTVSLPKLEEAKPRKIEIQAS